MASLVGVQSQGCWLGSCLWRTVCRERTPVLSPLYRSAAHVWLTSVLSPWGPCYSVSSVLVFTRGRGVCYLSSLPPPPPGGLCSSCGCESFGAVRVLVRLLAATDPAPSPLMLQCGRVPGGLCNLCGESESQRSQLSGEFIWTVCCSVHSPLSRVHSHSWWRELFPLGAFPMPSIWHLLRPSSPSLPHQSGFWTGWALEDTCTGTCSPTPPHSHLTKPAKPQFYFWDSTSGSLLLFFLHINLPFDCKDFKQPGEALMMIRLLALGSFCDNIDCMKHTHTHILYSEM